MKFIKYNYHKGFGGTAQIYEMDNGIEYVEWSNGRKYAYDGGRLMTEAETNEVDKAIIAQYKHIREMSWIERDLRAERNT